MDLNSTVLHINDVIGISVGIAWLHGRIRIKTMYRLQGRCTFTIRSAESPAHWFLIADAAVDRPLRSGCRDQGYGVSSSAKR